MKKEHCCFCTDSKNFMPTKRIHIPVAKKCSMGCNYCGYFTDKNITLDLSRPGTSSKVVSTREEIEQYLEEKMALVGSCDVIGVSGPGDPLENMDSLNELHEVLQEKYIEKNLCICTNGRYFDREMDKLLSWNELKYFSVTINTLNPSSVVGLYSAIARKKDAKQFISNQINAIEVMHNSGRKVKVNTIYIPGVNELEIENMFLTLRKVGADCFNLMRMQNINSYTLTMIDEYYESNFEKIRMELEGYQIPLTVKCKNCTADFCGV